MPDIIKGTKRKTPLSGGGAYLDYGGGTGGGSRTVSQTPAKTPSRSNASRDRWTGVNIYQKGGGSTSKGSTGGNAAKTPAKSSGSTIGGALGGALKAAVSDATRAAIGTRAGTSSAPVSSVPAAENPTQGAMDTSAGYTGSVTENVTDLSDYLRKQQAAATEAALAGLKSAYDKNVLEYNAQRGKIPGVYDTQRNALAANTAQERRSFDERAVASGLNTGTTGQAELARSALLQQGMAELGQSEADALAEIDLAKSQLQAEYENAIAQQKAQDEATLLERLYEEAVRQENARLSAAARMYSGSSSGRSGSSGGSLSDRVAEAVGVTGSKTTNAVNAAADKVKAIADAILGSIPGTRSTKGTGSSGSQLVSVPGYGQISYDDAETLERNGNIKLRGVDRTGNPVYTKTGKKNYTNPIMMSR